MSMTVVPEVDTTYLVREKKLFKSLLPLSLSDVFECLRFPLLAVPVVAMGAHLSIEKAIGLLSQVLVLSLKVDKYSLYHSIKLGIGHFLGFASHNLQMFVKTVPDVGAAVFR